MLLLCDDELKTILTNKLFIDECLTNLVLAQASTMMELLHGYNEVDTVLCDNLLTESESTRFVDGLCFPEALFKQRDWRSWSRVTMT